MRSLFAVAIGVLLALAVWASAAGADVFGPIELTSTSAPSTGQPEQSGEARFPVISSSGRYVAFVGSFGGERGIWRRDLATGTVEHVAPGVATLPSISASGRYVSFTTTERLVAQDTNNSPDVYVRDMEPAPGEAEYTLVSAVNGSDEGTAYKYTGQALGNAEFDEREYGSIAAARSAISADGNLVVFETTAQSDLLGEAAPTPPLQVLVRDLATHETRLVSAEYEPLAGRPANGEDRPVPIQQDQGEQYGAIFPGGVGTPTFGGARGPNGQAWWVGASISADGSTVAWMGQGLERQTQLLSQERGESHAVLAEPLWRRIADGPSAPIRRVTGGSDTSNPQCLASGESSDSNQQSDPCAGPFERYRELDEGLWSVLKNKGDFVPQLSANGMVVAFTTGARELASGEQEFPEGEHALDLFVVNMASGLTRTAALNRLTAISGGGPGSQEALEKSASIYDYSVSPDGAQVAFTTQRTAFALGSPAFVSTPAATAGMIELFDVDLDNDTLTRVTHGFGGEDERSEELPTTELPGIDPYHAEQGAYSPSFSGDGNILSFASTANNLVYGDGNDEPDTFVAHRLLPTPGVVQQYISSPPPNPAVAPTWAIGARAVSLPDGSLRLYVTVPGGGVLTAGASGAVVVHIKVRKLRRGSHRALTVAKLETRKLASTRSSVPATTAGLAQLALKLTAPYRSLASVAGGLSATVSLSFAAPGRPVVRTSVPATFARTLKSTKKKASKARARGAR